jgi:hypothetical protein
MIGEQAASVRRDGGDGAARPSHLIPPTRRRFHHFHADLLQLIHRSPHFTDLLTKALAGAKAATCAVGEAQELIAKAQE